MGTFSFLDVVATLAGPGGSIQLGAGAGAAKEGISIEPIEDKDFMLTGADGEIMHGLRGSQAARITVRLLKTSPVNAQLQNLFNAQRTASSLWGQNVLQIRDVVRGDLVNGSQIAFARQPSITWAEDPSMNEWSFMGRADVILGSGSPVA